MRPIYYLLGLVPVAVALDLLDVSPAAVFVVSAVAVIPCAALMGEATEQLAEHSGPGVAGLLNVTFGNAPELIIALFALADGLQEVVKASLVGSVMGNALLVLGASLLAGGGAGRARPTTSAPRARWQGVLLFGTAALLVPSLVRLAEGGALPRSASERGSFGTAAEMVSLVVSVAADPRLRARPAALAAQPCAHEAPGEDVRWSARRAALVLGIQRGARRRRQRHAGRLGRAHLAATSGSRSSSSARSWSRSSATPPSTTWRSSPRSRTGST